MARSRQMSLAEWVRQALERARRKEPLGDVGKKLEMVRSSARCEFPTANIERMLAEIEGGYLSGTHS
jgi:hypothetical protein